MTETHETLDELAEQVERGVAPCVAADEVLGLTWLVARGGRARRGAVGHLDAERTRPAQLDSIFRISSMTKPMTAAVALMLVEDGAAPLGDPIEIKIRGYHLTLRKSEADHVLVEPSAS